MRTRSLLLLSLLAGCTGGPVPPGMDASVDAGPRDAGRDAGADAGTDAGTDAGPVCGPEVCDGVDNDCNGTVDLLPDGGTIFGLCPLQQGPCAGARVACFAGGFPPCTATQYGSKYEEFESLCDGVDNDCSGVADVSQWKPIGAPGEQTKALSVPGAWYVGRGIEGQMFDEALQPLTEPFVVGSAGHSNGGAVWVGNYIHALFPRGPASGPTFVRLLNLNGTPLGAADTWTLPYPQAAGGFRATNDGSALLVALDAPGAQALATLGPTGTVRADATFGDAGTWQHVATAVYADRFVAALPRLGFVELVEFNADMVFGTRLNLAVPGDPAACAISANTRAADAGSFVVVCPSAAGTLFGTDDPMAGLAPLWSSDGGPITGVTALPSYAKATVFWLNRGTLFMGQVNGLPAVELAQLSPAPTTLQVAESVRGGYLLQAVFDGGQGVRPYGAYACPP